MTDVYFKVVSDAKGLSNKTLLEYTRLSRDDESVVEKLSARVKVAVLFPIGSYKFETTYEPVYCVSLLVVVCGSPNRDRRTPSR